MKKYILLFGSSLLGCAYGRHGGGGMHAGHHGGHMIHFARSHGEASYHPWRHHHQRCTWVYPMEGFPYRKCGSTF